jgi:deoxynucleoside triphosphate triphosphohydrolase SAMHD1
VIRPALVHLALRVKLVDLKSVRLNANMNDFIDSDGTNQKRSSPSNQSKIDPIGIATVPINISMEDSSYQSSSLDTCDVTKRARTGSTPSKQKNLKLSSNTIVTEHTVRWLKSGIMGSRRTNDEIHSFISFCPVMTAIIDSRVFQRLRGLKQLATAYLVYNNGNHSRFEHSLGVAHLAEKLMKCIREKQPAMQQCTTEKDVLCVKLAGLLHDLGHGPFSHTFETFVNKAPEYKSFVQSNEESKPDQDCGNHESCSLRMIDYLLFTLGLQIDTSDSGLRKPLKQIGDGVNALAMRYYTKDFDSSKERYHHQDESVLTSQDWIYIKELILGGPLPGNNGIVGRPDYSYAWTYDIVANKSSGLDVDKIDYYARDDRRCCRASGEIKKHFIEEAYVAWVSCSSPKKISCCPEHYYREKRLTICHPMKSKPKVVDFFRHRSELHTKIYQHKTCVAANLMLVEIFCLSDPYFRFGRDGGVSLSQAMKHPEVFEKLEDSIIDIIEITVNPRLAEAQRLIQRLKSRNLYRFAGVKILMEENPYHLLFWEKTELDIKSEMLAMNCSHDDGILLQEADFSVVKVEIHWGQKERNPVLNVSFLEKTEMENLNMPLHELPEAGRTTIEGIQGQLPRFFLERQIRVYSRSTEQKVTNLLSRIFNQWWVEINSKANSAFFCGIDEQSIAGDESDSVKPRAVILTQDSCNSDVEEYDDDFILDSKF